MGIAPHTENSSLTTPAETLGNTGCELHPSLTLNQHLESISCKVIPGMTTPKVTVNSMATPVTGPVSCAMVQNSSTQPLKCTCQDNNGNTSS